jgi:hypothetical protein
MRLLKPGEGICVNCSHAEKHGTVHKVFSLKRCGWVYYRACAWCGARWEVRERGDE